MSKVLVIEDHEDSAFLIQAALDEHDVRVALSLHDGLSAIDEEMPAVVITDLNLPDSDSPQQVVDRLKTALSAAPKTKLIALSGDADIRQIAQQAGIDYLAKPFSLDVLRDKLTCAA